MPTQSALQQEWLCLQNQFDSYEKYSLIIKLTNMLLTLGLLAFSLQPYLALLCAGVLWLQDAIWKTFQSRIEARLLSVEASLQSADETSELVAMQFNQQWQATRPGLVGLVKEYLSQAYKPTVAFPHVILIVVTALFSICQA